MLNERPSSAAGVNRGAATAPIMLFVGLIVLSLGHVLSNLMRTMPSVTIDLMAADLDASPQVLIGLTSAYHFAFALSQIPIGIALDRYGIRQVSLVLFIGTVAGAALAAVAQNAISFTVAQAMLGVFTSGMLMTPLALAARSLPASRFAVWSGIILAVGNSGMLLSASPLAYFVEAWGWRAAFWASAAAAVLVACVIAMIVPNSRPEQRRATSVIGELSHVMRLSVSPALRGIIMLALVALAVMIVLRGIWGGPWLMEVKGLTRVEAGNVLLAFTVTMVVGPLIAGALDQRIRNRRAFVATTQGLVAVLLLVMAGGGPGGPISNLVGVAYLSPAVDTGLLLGIGLLGSAQFILYTMARDAVSPADTGKALAAANLGFFLGTAVMQSVTSPVASLYGLPAVLATMAGMMAIGVMAFCIAAPPGAAKTPR